MDKRQTIFQNKENYQKDVKNYSCILFICVILLVLLFPLSRINSMETSKNENRTLAKKPSLFVNGKINKSFGKEFDDYLSDRFRGRKKLISTFNLIDRFFIGRLENNKAMLGSDGFLFYKDRIDGDSISNYSNKKIFSENELITIKNNIISQRDLLKNDGIKFYVMIAPDKNRIYGENYPKYIFKKGEQSRARQLVSYMKQFGIDIVYPEKELLDAKKNGISYFRLDTHWNNYAAFIGYSSIMRQIKNDYNNLKIFKETDFDLKYLKETDGDLLRMLDVNVEEVRIPNNKVLQLQPKQKYNYQYLKNGDNQDMEVETINNFPLNKLRLAMLRDSFTVSLEPYLSDTFSHSLYIWKYSLNSNYDKILDSKPDIVILEIVERSIPALLHINKPRIARPLTDFNFQNLIVSNDNISVKFNVEYKKENKYSVEFKGWAYSEKTNVQHQQVFLLAENELKEKRIFSLGQEIREDVGIYFKDPVYKYTGFNVLIRKSDLFKGINKFRLIVLNGERMKMTNEFWNCSL